MISSTYQRRRNTHPLSKVRSGWSDWPRVAARLLRDRAPTAPLWLELARARPRAHELLRPELDRARPHTCGLLRLGSFRARPRAPSARRGRDCPACGRASRSHSRGQSRSQSQSRSRGRSATPSASTTPPSVECRRMPPTTFAAAPAGATGGTAMPCLRTGRLGCARPHGCGTATRPWPNPRPRPSRTQSLPPGPRGSVRCGDLEGATAQAVRAAAGIRGQWLACAPPGGHPGWPETELGPQRDAKREQPPPALER